MCRDIYNKAFMGSLPKSINALTDGVRLGRDYLLEGADV